MEHDWPQILSAHGPAVWRILLCMVGHDADARDCYQTVFLEAFQYSHQQTVIDWDKLLKRIARARGIDALRKRYRAAARIDATADPGDSVSQLSTPENEAVAAELTDQLRCGLALLPPQQAEVFVMRFVEHLSYDQIAERTGSNRNAVGAMLARARTQLRQHLEEANRTAVEYRRDSHDQ
ncbi:MAG: sigma-70 family RNA polymerase sigma factor [Planctomycetota bacterium]